MTEEDDESTEVAQLANETEEQTAEGEDNEHADYVCKLEEFAAQMAAEKAELKYKLR